MPGAIAGPTIEGMSGTQPREAIALYPFEHFDPVRRRWVAGRYRGTLDDIGARHGPFRITGAPKIRESGNPSTLTAGHLASSPRR